MPREFARGQRLILGFFNSQVLVSDDASFPLATLARALFWNAPVDVLRRTRIRSEALHRVLTIGCLTANHPGARPYHRKLG